MTLKEAFDSIVEDGIAKGAGDFVDPEALEVAAVVMAKKLRGLLVEVVHGEWLDGGAICNGKEVYKSIDCSHCEEVFKIESHDREYWKARFKVCPFCGANMMDGDGNG